MDMPVPESLAEPIRPVRLGFQILLGLANAGATVTLIPVLVVLIPAQATAIDPINPAASLALVLAVGAIAAMIANPLAGALSDRTTSRLGRRRPWLLVGMSGSVVGLALLANSRSIPALTLGWVVTQFAGNILLSCFGAVLPDRIPVRQRGSTQAIVGLASPVAIVLSDLLFAWAPDYRLAYYPIIAVVIVLILLFFFLYREAPLPPGSQPSFRIKSFLASFWIDPRRHPRFALAWLLWLCVWLGYNVGTGGFFFLYVQNIIAYESLFPGHRIQEGMAMIQIIQIGLGIPLMIAAGVLSDRLARRKEFVWTGGALIGAGLAALVAFSSWGATLAAGVAIGAGFWIAYSLGLALITQILPSASNRGKDLGVMNIASTLPQIAIPPIGAFIVNGLGVTNPVGYKILFGIGILAMAAAMGLLRFIRERD